MSSQNLFQDLETRGLVKQITDPELPRQLSEGPITLYAGFDPSADSLHIGSLLPLLTLRRFQLAGHRPIAVVGGATGMIGDPSGKSQERSLLTEERIQDNLQGLRQVISRFLEFDGPAAARMLNNGDWFKGVSYIDFLRDVGKHFTINHMMAKESIRARLEDREHGISYTEFSYMLLQAYDFYILNKNEGCSLQVGGSDQWGNITAGIELARRINAANGSHVTTLFGLTLPLISKTDGTKFGKTEQGAIWLSADKTSPYRFYQFLIQTADADVISFLKFFTFLPLERIGELELKLRSAPEKREAQHALAEELTRLVHGEMELKRAIKSSEALFGDGIRDLDEKTLLEVLSGAPATVQPRENLSGQGIPLADLLVATGLCSSKGIARKEISAGGIYVNNSRISEPATSISSVDLISGRHVVLRKGKKNYHLVSFK